MPPPLLSIYHFKYFRDLCRGIRYGEIFALAVESL